MLPLLLIILAFSGGASAVEPGRESFRFHLLSEPHSMDPQRADGSGGNYVFQNIYRGLFRFHSARGLIPEGAKSCQRRPHKLICTLNPNHRWSNGVAIRAEDYVQSFQRVIDPAQKSRASEMLLNLKNARAIAEGKLPATRLGVSALSASRLQFEFSVDDPEFEFKLINTALVPWPPGGLLEREDSPKMLFSGPYKITEWKPNHFVHLTANKSYGLPAAETRPDLEAVFIESDPTALRLYESGKLNFLRRLTAGEIPRYKGAKDFLQVPMARFDYVGFGPSLEPYEKLREALTESVDFASFLLLFDTKGPPGCPSLPAKLLDRTVCMKFTPELAKRALPPPTEVPKLSFHFSRMGGDDISRAAEWFQGQWKKNLGVLVELSSQEQIVHLQNLRSNPPAIFRKGVNLDRPTCLAAVELFTTGHPENYIRFHSPTYDKLVERLRVARGVTAKRVACRQAIETLMASHRLIPLGEMYFTILMNPKFQSWDLNELNQLDLTNLTEVQ